MNRANKQMSFFFTGYGIGIQGVYGTLDGGRDNGAQSSCSPIKTEEDQSFHLSSKLHFEVFQDLGTDGEWTADRQKDEGSFS